jgi:hypothetical protein
MNCSIVFNNFGKDASDSLRQATQKKDEGNINEAIELLKTAYKEIAKTNVDYPIETFLRLPLYLQTAGRSKEAWEEFNKLLENGYPNENRIKELIPMHESHIYDKMRLFLQREKEFDNAVSYGVFSLISEILGLYNQKSTNELKETSDISYIIDRVTPLLKKSKKLHLLNDLTKIIQNQLNKLPNVSFEYLRQEIEILLKGSS